MSLRFNFQKTCDDLEMSISFNRASGADNGQWTATLKRGGMSPPVEGYSYFDHSDGYSGLLQYLREFIECDSRENLKVEDVDTFVAWVRSIDDPDFQAEVAAATIEV